MSTLHLILDDLSLTASNMSVRFTDMNKQSYDSENPWFSLKHIFILSTD